MKDSAPPAWLVPLLVATLTFVAFLPALEAGFVTWDDDKNFLANPSYRGLGAAQLGWMWTTFHLGHYVPLTWMSLGLDYSLWGMKPGGYHLTNVALHSANAVLVYALARRIFARTLPSLAPLALALASALAALLFSLHPLRVESVAWVTERRDVLSMLFALSSALCYLRSTDDDAPTAPWYALSLGLFACALLSKATSLTLPALLLILNAHPLRRLGTASQRRAVMLELASFVLLSVATSVLTLVALQRLPQLGPFEKVAVSSYSLAFYLWKTIVPENLAPLYAMPAAIDPLALRYLASYALVVALSAGAWLARRRWPGVTTAWVAFLVAILPLLGLVQNGPQIAADRYTYFAAPALALLAAGAIVSLRGPLGEITTGAAAFVLVALGFLTWRQAGVWHDSSTLWTQVLRVEPHSAIARNNMGNVLFLDRRINDAIDHYRRALAVAPNYAEAHNNLGVALSKQGNLAGAIAAYQRAVAANPASAEAHANWGTALDAIGRPDESLEHFRIALSLEGNADTQVNYGNALVKIGQVDSAIRLYKEVALRHPDHVEAHLNWGVALARQGKLAEAVGQFRLTLALKPESPEALEYLARLVEIQRTAR